MLKGKILLPGMLALRLLVLSSFSAVLTIGLIFLAMYWVLENRAEQEVHIRVRNVVGSLQNLLPLRGDLPAPPRMVQVFGGMTDVRALAIYCGQPAIVYAAADQTQVGAPADELFPEDRGQDFPPLGDDENIRGAYQPDQSFKAFGATHAGSRECTIRLVLDTALIAQNNGHIILQLLIIVGALVLLSFLFNYRILYLNVLNPLAVLKRTMEQRATGGEAAAPDLRPDEIGQVGMALNRMMRVEAESMRVLASLMQRLQGILDTVTDGIVTVDANGRITSFNPAAERLFGYDGIEMIGRKFDMLFPEPYCQSYSVMDENREASRLSRSLGSGREIEGLHKNGERFPVELGLSEMQTDAQKSYVACIHDITERRRAQAHLDVLVADLSRSNTELERFAYLASHDLQEPLRMVVNFNSLLERRYADKLDERGREYVRISVEAGRRMRDMLIDLLEYARIGREADQSSTFSAAVELVHVLENLREAIEEQGAVVTCGELPVVTANPVRFLRLLQNLIGNGIKYQPEGQKAEISVTAEWQGDEWLFCVADNGIGIEKEYLDQVFQPFKRLHASAYYKGTGIGLAICRRIVENWGGRIWIESKPGQGSRFYFTIPV